MQTYKEFIDNIIAKRGKGGISKDEYFESHHILPKCLGGLPKNNSCKAKHDNIIGLYPEEHYIAHKLLALENPDIPALTCAGWYMSTAENNHQARYKISASEYKELKLYYKKHGFSEETRKKMSDSHKGVRKTFSEEHKKRISESRKGKAPWNKGLKLHWYTNGINDVQCLDCPEGYHRGRTNGINRNRDMLGRFSS